MNAKYEYPIAITFSEVINIIVTMCIIILNQPGVTYYNWLNKSFFLVVEITTLTASALAASTSMQ